MSRVQGFNNAGGKSVALTTGCNKPLILTKNGKGSIAYRECMERYNSQQALVQSQQAAAAAAEAAAAPDKKAAAEALARAEEQKTARAMSPLAISGIVFGSLIIIGGFSYLIWGRN